jgi:hypothetical protein
MLILKGLVLRLGHLHKVEFGLLGKSAAILPAAGI